MRMVSPWRHPDSGIFYFRRVIPADLRPIVGRREVRVSLQTTDPFEARFRFLRASMECEQLIQEARAKRLSGWMPSPDEDNDTDAGKAAGCSLTLTQLHDRWLLERKPADQTAREWRAARRRFLELHGDLPVGAVTRAHAISFRRLLRELPARPPKSIAQLPAPRQAEIAEAQGLPRLSAQTVAKNLNWLKALFGVALEEGLVESSPVRGLSERDPVPAREKRMPYSVDQLNLIYGSGLYSDAPLPSRGRAALKPVGPHCRWLPLLATFTGARLEELAQMRTDDVVIGAQCAFVRFSHFDSDGRPTERRYKSSNAMRMVPLHPTLVEVGFLDFVARRLTSGAVDLFPELEANSKNKRSAAFSKRWGPFTRTIGIRDERLSFHSFRHSFADACDAAGLSETAKRQVMGHSLKGTYGGSLPPVELWSAIRGLAYPGLRLPRSVPDAG